MSFLHRSLSVLLSGAIATLTLQTSVLAQTLSEQVMGMEQRLESEFETYFGREIAEVNQSPEDIAKTLAQLGAATQTNPAVMWVIPRETHLHLVLITPNGEPIVKDLYDVPKNLLRETAAQFTNDITNARKKPNLQAAQQLYRWLIEPYEAEFLQPAGIDTILFCLGSGVRGLPLAALHDGEQFLIEKYALTRIPAFNLIDTNYQNIQQGGILAMGAETFVEQPPLHAVPLEVQTIVQTLNTATKGRKSWSDLALLNEDFTLANLKTLLTVRDFDIVHLATHADFQPGRPAASYIQFADGRLTLDQIAALPWQASPVELLVLSACRTAVGDDEAELGFAGLALQAGVKSAIASLWYVSDAGTLALMGDFYAALTTNRTKAEALRQTQLKMLRGDIKFTANQLQLSRGVVPIPDALNGKLEVINDLSHPYYWSGFSLISSPW